MPPEPSPKKVAKPSPPKKPLPPVSKPRTAPPSRVGVAPPSGGAMTAAMVSTGPGPGASGDVGIAVSADSASGGVVTARRAGGLRDMGLEVNPAAVGLGPALQHLAKAVNIAFQTDYGENYLESVYQAAIVRKGEIHIVHREYFGYGNSWFGEFGMLLKSMALTFEGPDPASPEGRQRLAESGRSTIRGLFNLLGRKLDLVAEFEDKVPAYVEQMFDRLEGSGIIIGWNRDDWDISTTTIGLNIRIRPKTAE